MPGLRAVLDGGGRACAVGEVLLAAVPGESLPGTAGVTERCCGNAVVERKLGPGGLLRCSRTELAGGVRFERPCLALCPAISGPRHRLR